MEKKIEFMLRAIELSKNGLESGKGGPFGCVIVKDGKIIGEGKNINSFQLEGCEVYTSCEPCPMCLGAIYWARPDKIYFANNRSDAAEIGFDDAFIYDEIGEKIENRQIQMEPLGRMEALEIFKQWKLKTDKIEY